LFLAGHGVPWDVLQGLEDHERLAYCVVIGEQNGESFDWDRMRWEDKK